MAFTSGFARLPRPQDPECSTVQTCAVRPLHTRNQWAPDYGLSFAFISCETAPHTIAKPVYCVLISWFLTLPVSTVFSSLPSYFCVVCRSPDTPPVFGSFLCLYTVAWIFSKSYIISSLPVLLAHAPTSTPPCNNSKLLYTMVWILYYTNLTYDFMTRGFSYTKLKSPKNCRQNKSAPACKCEGQI